MRATGVLSRQPGLRQAERSFRITGLDPRSRPVRHWIPDRVRAHIATSFMALACPRHLACRAELLRRCMPPEVVHSAHIRRQCSIMRCRRTNYRHILPSKPTPNATRRIPGRASGLPWRAPRWTAAHGAADRGRQVQLRRANGVLSRAYGRQRGEQDRLAHGPGLVTTTVRCKPVRITGSRKRSEHTSSRRPASCADCRQT